MTPVARKKIKLIIETLLVIFLVFPWQGILASAPRQEFTPEEQAQALLPQLSPEERVGQLFLASFNGTDTGEHSQVYDLVANQHIGGVVLSVENDNFTSGDGALSQTLALNSELQRIRWQSAQRERTSFYNGERYTPKFIPLLIAISQEGDGSPFDQIISGVTPLPNQMAIGAAWKPELATEAGKVLGSELSALGFNLLLGPSLDVLDTPQPETDRGLGVRSFGGDPYWVGQMGKAYIEGVHTGSQGKMLLAAKHFPGNGAADRLPEEEVATVLKLLEQLVKFDLVPFFEVTGRASNPETTSDILLTSHIRYQGFQGNIRATTRPVSFDQQAISTLMALPELAAWRERGGVLLSDDLGSQAIRRFFELTNPNQPFDARRVAVNAFLAGNDIIYLGNIIGRNDPDPYTTTQDVLDFFVQKYNEDTAFADRVDQSVLRILALKYRINPTLTLSNALPPEDGLNNLEDQSQVTFTIAREAATLISPSLTELDSALPDPPNLSDRMVFITDVRKTAQCSKCPLQTSLGIWSLPQAVIQLYGTQASGQINPAYITAYSFEDLQHMLDGNPEFIQLANDLRRAHWIVFAMRNVTPDVPASSALNRFLVERPDLFQQKRLITFAFNTPTYLDATNVSKLSAYYALYSKTPPFIDVAARLLFQELRPSGSLPISIPGIGYDLFEATLPDPDQTIPLRLDISSGENTGDDSTPEPMPTPEYRLGSIIPVRTGVILDHNGHPVPDGTLVLFVTAENGQINSLPVVATTFNGVAQASVQVTNSGTLEISVESEPAQESETLRFDIPAENGEIISSTPPTPLPTSTPAPVPTETLTPTSMLVTPPPVQPAHPTLLDWVMAMLIAISAGMITYRIQAYMGQIRWGVRSGFMAFIGGLLAYSYLVMDFPGGHDLLDATGAWGIILMTFGGSLIGILFSWAWRKLQPASRAPR